MALNHDNLIHCNPVQPGNPTKHHHLQSPPHLSSETLQRSISDISYKLKNNQETTTNTKCECCGMSEECTPEYVSRVRGNFSGKMVCGLCSEAVKEEVEKNGGRRDKALEDHVVACERFNRLGRAYPLLLQAEDVKKILKKKRSSNCPNSLGFRRSKPLMNPREKGSPIARSSSCIPAITKEMSC